MQTRSMARRTLSLRTANKTVHSNRCDYIPLWICAALILVIAWYGIMIYLDQFVHLDHVSVEAMSEYIGRDNVKACEDRTLDPVRYTQGCIANTYLKMRAANILGCVIVPAMLLYGFYLLRSGR